MDKIIQWHKDYSESWRKRLGLSHYGIYWVSFFKGVLIVLLLQAIF